jgi:hypothetical protein
LSKEYIAWIEPNGVEHDLSGSANIDVMIGPSGRFMPTFELVDQEVPFLPGSRLRNIKTKPREVDLPIEISGLSTSDLRTQLRKIMDWFNPLKGDGTLKVIAEDGSQRLLTCRYASGLEIQETGLSWLKAVLVLKAFDPFWYDANVIVQTFTTGQPATFFPFFPLRLTNSTVFADTTIINSGDVEAWPTWIITGPGSNIYLRNLTTGELTNINVTLGVGETINIDTRQGKKTVVKGDGTNLYPNLSSGSSLWALQQGTNQIRLEMSGASTQSSIQLSYQNRYWGA